MKKLFTTVAADMRANPRDPKIRIALISFRLTQALMGSNVRPRLISWPVILGYRVFTEILLGFELRPKTEVGKGLTIYHGFGLVVNDHSTLGKNVVLRNGVVIGTSHEGGPSPTIEDDVNIGAGAMILGGITVGRGARVGAGAVVVKDVPAFSTVVGNPGRLL